MVNDENDFLDSKQVNKWPTTKVYKICTYVQNEIKLISDAFDFAPDSERKISTPYIHENPVLDVSNIEDLIKEMNLRRVKKRYELSSKLN